MIPLGIINHSPDFITHKFKQLLNLEDRDFVICVGDLPKKRPKVLIFISVALFRRHLEVLNSAKYVDVIVCVFSDPIKLLSFDLIPFDYKVSEDIHIDAFVLVKPTMTKLKDKQVKYERVDFLSQLLDKVQSFDGILTQFMSFIYTMPNATHQKPIKEMVCNWLISNESVADLNNRIAKIRIELKMTDKQVKRLLDIVTSPVADVYKRVLRQTANCKDLYSQEFIKVVTSNKLSAYEIRYIRSVIDKK